MEIVEIVDSVVGLFELTFPFIVTGRESVENLLPRELS